MKGARRFTLLGYLFQICLFLVSAALLHLMIPPSLCPLFLLFGQCLAPGFCLSDILIFLNLGSSLTLILCLCPNLISLGIRFPYLTCNSLEIKSHAIPWYMDTLCLDISSYIPVPRDSDSISLLGPQPHQVLLIA